MATFSLSQIRVPIGAMEEQGCSPLLVTVVRVFRRLGCCCVCVAASWFLQVLPWWTPTSMVGDEGWRWVLLQIEGSNMCREARCCSCFRCCSGSRWRGTSVGKLEKQARCCSSSCGRALQFRSWMKMVFARRFALVLWRWWLLVREWWMRWWRGVVVMVLMEASMVVVVGCRFGLGFQVCEMGRRWWGVTL